MVGVGAVCGLGLGCAQYPATVPGNGSKRLIFTLTVAGKINPNYVYMVALNPSTDLNPTVQGPIPVIAPPWGNGFVAGTCTYFVQWNPLVTPDYQLYQFTDATLQNYFQIGSPVVFVDPTTGGNTLQFDLDLSQITPTGQGAANYQSIQVNFLTMDRIPHGTSGSKNWDALGDGRTLSGINRYITVPLNTTGIYDNNRYGGLEPQGDVQTDGDPDLDIVNFSVEVRNS